MAHSFNRPSTPTTGYITPQKPLVDSANYQVITDEPGVTQYVYKAGTIEQPFKVTLRSNAIKSVGGLKVVNPAPNKGGAVQYSIKVETIGRRSTPSVAGAIEDEGISMWLTVKHDATDNWDASDLMNIFRTLLGTIIKSDVQSAGELGSAAYAFSDLAKGVTRRF